MALCWDRRRTLPPATAAFARHLTQTAGEPFDPPAGTEQAAAL
jgi:hypothetical protein